VTPIGWVGVWLLVVAGVAIVVEGAVMTIWSLRLARRAQMMATRLEEERRLIQADVERLRQALEETRRLWKPYRRILRWLRHPLVLALIGSYRRRWAAR
jgi:hypothetical protein